MSPYAQACCTPQEYRAMAEALIAPAPAEPDTQAFVIYPRPTRERYRNLEKANRRLRALSVATALVLHRGGTEVFSATGLVTVGTLAAFHDKTVAFGNGQVFVQFIETLARESDATLGDVGKFCEIVKGAVACGHITIGLDRQHTAQGDEQEYLSHGK